MPHKASDEFHDSLIEHSFRYCTMLSEQEWRHFLRGILILVDLELERCLVAERERQTDFLRRQCVLPG